MFKSILGIFFILIACADMLQLYHHETITPKTLFHLGFAIIFGIWGAMILLKEENPKRIFPSGCGGTNDKTA